jgi:hypothetical protein
MSGVIKSSSFLKINFIIMKKIFILLLTTVSSIGFSQVAIGKQGVTNSDVSLEFGQGNKGIILPWVNSEAAVSDAVPGTIIYDVTDKKVKVKQLNSWRDLSVRTGDVSTTLQDDVAERGNAKVIIGKDHSNPTPGILVLSDSDKAMILPKMENPHLNIKNPEAGMMAYDTLSHQLAVFNGSVWTFWKP